MKTLYTTLATLLFAIGSTSAMAQAGGAQQGGGAGQPAQQQSLFDSLDRNGDGKLDKEEAGAAGLAGSTFEEADGNGDGSISEKELDKFRSQGAPQR